jgi:hypothetical protein
MQTYPWADAQRRGCDSNQRSDSNSKTRVAACCPHESRCGVAWRQKSERDYRTGRDILLVMQALMAAAGVRHFCRAQTGHWTRDRAGSVRPAASAGMGSGGSDACQPGPAARQGQGRESMDPNDRIGMKPDACWSSRSEPSTPGAHRGQGRERIRAFSSDFDHAAGNQRPF